VGIHVGGSRSISPTRRVSIPTPAGAGEGLSDQFVDKKKDWFLSVLIGSVNNMWRRTGGGAGGPNPAKTTTLLIQGAGVFSSQADRTIFGGLRKKRETRTQINGHDGRTFIGHKRNWMVGGSRAELNTRGQGVRSKKLKARTIQN